MIRYSSETRMKRFALFVSLALCAWLARPSQASAARVALLVGNDEGQGADVRLRFAQSDAARLGSLLARMGGFSPDKVVVLAGRTADDVRRALEEMATHLRSTPGEHVALVFYSGHADGQDLHLGRSSLPMTELREAVATLPAAVRVLILDACQSGIVTRAKGGVPGPGYFLGLQERERTQGLAILAASAASELAQESDQLGGAVFTHYLQAGLSGLADRDGDGGVSLGEVFDYAADRTLGATMGSAAGPQHPTFRIDLQGTGDLMVTRPGAPGAGYGHVRLDVPGWYFVRRADGTIVAEVISRGGELLALDAGRYEVSRRGSRSLDVAALVMNEGDATPISAVATRPIAFGVLVRKGGGPPLSYGLSVATAARTSIADLGAPLGMALAARADLSALSLEIRLELGRAHSEAPHLSSTTWESAISVAAVRVHDFGSPARGALLAGAIGLQAGLAYLAQTLDTGDHHSSYSPFLGPTAIGELALGKRYFLRGTADASLYALHVQKETGAAIVYRPAIGATLGAGAWFWSEREERGGSRSPSS